MTIFMLSALRDLLCSKQCQHNWPGPSERRILYTVVPVLKEFNQV